MPDSPDKTKPNIHPLLRVTLLVTGSAAIVRTITMASTPQNAQPSYIPTVIAAAVSAALVFVYVGWKKRWFTFSLRLFVVVMAAIAPMPDSQDKRRWWQFSLKAVLVLTLAVAAFFGGRASNRQIAKDALREAQTARDRVAQARSERENDLFHAILPGKWKRNDTGDVVTFRKSGECESESLGKGWWRVSGGLRLSMRFDPVVVDDGPPVFDDGPPLFDADPGDGYAFFEGVNKFEFFPDTDQKNEVVFTRVVESTH